MSVKIVAIAGITGKMGRLITKSLLHNHPEITIHGIARSPEKLPKALKNNPNIKVFKAEATDVSVIRSALKGADVCACSYLGDHELMLAGQKTLVDACIAEGVPRYIASDYSLDFRKLEYGQHPQKDPMKHIEEYLDEKDKETGGKIKGVHVLNGAFMEVIFSPFLRMFDAKNGVYNMWGTLDERLDLTTYEDTAAFTAEVAADPSAVGFLNGK
jgi:hypothetical protein